MSSRLLLHRLGQRATDESIEPSCGVMDVVTDGSVSARVVVDCGLTPVPGGRGEHHLPDFRLFEDGRKIDAVCITHVHADHVAGLTALTPYLAKDARVFMTKGSEAMAMTVLMDGLENEYDLEGKRRVQKVLSRIMAIRRPGEIEILPGLKSFVNPEGHINGACSFTFEVAGRRVHYAGDRCSHNQPGVNGALMLPYEWRPDIIAGSDCTYGADPDSDKRTWQNEMRRGLELCADTLNGGHNVLFFSFGLHRGGAIAHALQDTGMDMFGRLFLDGKCRTYAKIVESGRAKWSVCDTELTVTAVEHVENRSRIVRSLGDPYAVVSTPGMGGPGGAATFWRRHILPDPDAAAIFTGYIAPGTDGDKILKAVRERNEQKLPYVAVPFEVRNRAGEIEIETIKVACKVDQIRIGSHDSRHQVLDWFRRLQPEVAVLSHGSKAALDSLSAELTPDIPRLHRADQGALEIDL